MMAIGGALPERHCDGLYSPGPDPHQLASVRTIGDAVMATVVLDVAVNVDPN
jgi:hypothetical protein